MFQALCAEVCTPFIIEQSSRASLLCIFTLILATALRSRGGSQNNYKDSPTLCPSASPGPVTMLSYMGKGTLHKGLSQGPGDGEFPGSSRWAQC